MLRIFDPNRQDEPPKPWLVRVLADNDSARPGANSRSMESKAVLWAAILAVVSILYRAFH